MSKSSRHQEETGTPRRIYFDDEANNILDTHASALGPRTRSMVVCALLRALAGLPPRPGEERVHEQLKKVYAREQFLSFLRAVSDALPPGAKPLLLPQNRANHDPEAWTAGDTGILAFYAPGEANIGLLFSKATTIKAEGLLARVLVVTTNASTVPAAIRQDLAAASIHIVSLADFPATVKKHVP